MVARESVTFKRFVTELMEVRAWPSKAACGFPWA